MIMIIIIIKARSSTDDSLYAVASKVEFDERRQTRQVLDVFHTVTGEVQHTKVGQMLEAFYHADLHTARCTTIALL